jgi:hypothetical protein
MQATTKQRRTLRPWLAVPLVFALVATAYAVAETGVRLMIQGKTASNDVRVINGQAYVPLADMARAMNGKAVKNSDGYTIQMKGPGDDAISGGANEVHGTSGALGQMLFVGKWRFEAVSVSRAQSYESQFLPDHQTFAPNGDSEELVVVLCKLKNAQTSTQKAMLSSVHPHNIALTDDQGQSYGPLAFDKHTDSTDEGPSMLPGSQTTFAAIFSVPKGTKLKDMVFSLQVAYDDTPDGGTDVRISLAS